MSNRNYCNWFEENRSTLLEKSKSILSKKTLNFSLEEINNFGELIKKEVLLSEYNAREELYSIFICYYGNAWMHYFGGKWYYTKDKKDIAYGFPQLIEYGPKEDFWTAVSPYEYFIQINNGSMKELNEIIARRLKRYERNGIKNIKRENKYE